jgi:hypothetical protein
MEGCFCLFYSNMPLYRSKQETCMIALSVAKLRELDALYAERSSAGHPPAWGVLGEELRALRRAIEAGGVVHIAGGPTLRSWNDFYQRMLRYLAPPPDQERPYTRKTIALAP